MRKLFFLIATFGLAMLYNGTGASAQTSFDIDSLVTHQATNWGLATEAPSTAVSNYSSLGWSLAEVDSKLYVGGKFLDVQTAGQLESRPYFAAFDIRTGVWDPSFTPDVGGPVLSLENAPDGDLYVGGELKTWNGALVGGFVKVDPVTGGQDTSFKTRVYGGGAWVRDMELAPDGMLYIAGDFNTANDGGVPFSVGGIIRVDPATGVIDRNWLPDTSTFDSVWTVSRSHVNDNVYIGGRAFQQADNKGLLTVSAIDASVTWTGFAVNRTATLMHHVDANEFGRVFIGGTEHGLYIHDETNNMSLINNHVANYNTDLNPSRVRTGGDVQNITQVGDVVFATCHCWGYMSSSSSLISFTGSWDLADINATPVGGVNGLIAFDATTGARIQSFDHKAAGDLGGFDVLAASDGCLWSTGGFNSVGELGSVKPGRDLIRLCDADGGAVVLPAPASCEAVITGETVVVTWDEAVGADKYVIKRSVDGGNEFWRGATTDLTFTDTGREGTLGYSVTTAIGNDKSSATQCTVEVVVVPSTDGPQTCMAVVSNGDITVSWEAFTGATKYVIYRTVDGSNQYWRGAVENGLTFTDSNRSGVLEYHVLAVRADGSRSDRTACTDQVVVPPVPTVEAVSSCTAVASADGQSVTVSWDQINDANAEYIVSRSIDGGNDWWRGRVAASSFTDSLRDGQVEYSVQAKVGTTKADKVACTPVV